MIFRWDWLERFVSQCHQRVIDRLGLAIAGITEEPKDRKNKAPFR